MRINAITLANWFVDKAESEKSMPSYSNELTVLRLVKLVYIAYGFTLAIAERNILDERFDKVEAWKFGPVIPSVYYTFRHNELNRITQKEKIPYIQGNDVVFVTPELSEEDKPLEKIFDYVWRRYIKYSAKDLVDLLHIKNTPWYNNYIPGNNNVIPEEDTKRFYSNLVKVILGEA